MELFAIYHGMLQGGRVSFMATLICRSVMASMLFKHDAGPQGRVHPSRGLLGKSFVMQPFTRNIQSRRLHSHMQVVLTREKGKNAKLAKLLDEKHISWVELPLVETIDGPDRAALADAIREQKYQWTVITSPEAASVFLQGWKDAGSPQVQIAVVGEGTSQVLKKASCPDLLRIAFTPSKANAKHLSAELPLDSEGTQILYPASKKARPELQEGLEGRGCKVIRLNTYDTVPARSLSEEDIAIAKRAAVLAIASPSAVTAWVELVGDQPSLDLAIACIGSTSANAAKALGLSRIFSTESPGLPGFVEAIEEALASCQAMSQ